MFRVLTQCRHKGAIEATNMAVKTFSTRLLSHADPVFADIPKKMMLQVLDGLDNFVASVTRRYAAVFPCTSVSLWTFRCVYRSAGLPMLVRQIVSSEPKGKSEGRQLLDIAYARLVKLMERPVTARDDTEDNPQTHAIHILKSLVHDTELANSISPHLSKA